LACLTVKGKDGVAEIKFIHRPGRRNVKKASLFFNGAFFDRFRVGEPSFRAPDNKDDLPFEALGLVDRAEDDPFFVKIAFCGGLLSA
jgi:hypothetical protein